LSKPKFFINNKKKISHFELSVNKLLKSAITHHTAGNLNEAKNLYEQILFIKSDHLDALHLLGTILSQEGDFSQGLILLNKAVSINPSIAEIYCNIGFAYQGCNMLNDALNNFEKAIQLKYNYPQAHHNRAVILDSLNRIDESIKSFNIAISLNKNYAEAYCNLGVVLQKLDRFEEAEENYRNAILLNNSYYQAFNNIGVICKKLNNFPHALSNFKKAIEINKNYHIGYCNLGSTYKDLKLFEKALYFIDISLSIERNYADAWCNKGLVFYDSGKFHESLGYFDKAIDLDFNNSLYWCNKGLALSSLKRYDEAILHFDKSISLDSSNYESFLNKGVALRNTGSDGNAILNFNIAIEINKINPDGWLNKGVTLSGLKRFEEAIICHKKAIELNPDSADSHHNLSHTYLSMGNFLEGWEEYEWRWKTKKVEGTKPNFSKPEWNGERFEGRLLIWAEQGIGDQILYSSIFKDLSSYPQKKIISLDKKLIKIYQRSFPNFIFIDRLVNITEDNFDYQISIAGAVKFFRNSIDDFSKSLFPYLITDENRTEEISARIKGAQNQLICGLSWKSANADIGDFKSIPLREFEPILGLDTIKFVNLQYKSDAFKHEEEESRYGAYIHDTDVDIYNDIDSLASIIQACDIVITCSNTTAHLAGALNKNVVLLLPIASGRFWYWKDNDGKSVWYPSITILHQKTTGTWYELINIINSVLSKINL
jgi:tetratricopeptide (TPR) repeat protein